MASLAVIIATVDRTKVQLADHIHDKIDQAIVRQPLFHIWRQQEQLVRLIRFKASLILHSQIMTSEATMTTTKYSGQGSPTHSYTGLGDCNKKIC